MNATQAFGTSAYRRVGADGRVAGADPHQLILMLYDGAIAAVHQALVHLRGRNVAAKCAAVGKALRIVEEGLRAAVDRNAGGQLSFRLLDLYDYMIMRLLQANLRNDASALDEVARLLGELRGAWEQIAPNAQRGAPAAAFTPPLPAAGRPISAIA